MSPFVTGLVLAAGGSRRLGRPKQLLEYRDRPLLQHALDVAGGIGFDQLLVTVGGAADEVLAAVDLRGADVVVNEEFGTGCSSSIVKALDVVDVRADGLVLLLGDQPGVASSTVTSLLEAADPSVLAVCRYDDGRGHPFWLGRTSFADLANLHGDKGVWKVLESGVHPVVELPVAGDVPRDVDTWDDYQALLADDEEAPG